MKRSSIVTLALAVLALTGCTKQAVMPAADVTAAGERPRVWVTGWIDRDGEAHEFDGYVETRGDSLAFVDPGKRATGLERDRPGVVVVVHRDSVREVLGLRTDPTRTTFLVLGMAALVFGAVVLSAAASLASEPLL
jgi:hypothetical protein